MLSRIARAQLWFMFVSFYDDLDAGGLLLSILDGDLNENNVRWWWPVEFGRDMTGFFEDDHVLDELIASIETDQFDMLMGEILATLYDVFPRIRCAPLPERELA